MAKRASKLTHLDSANRPTMVDVGGKQATLREASAEAWVKLPPAVARELKRTGHRTKKGPIFDTAIIAGVMAAKRTHEIIPFCHPLPLERCTIDIADRPGGKIRIVCSVAVHHRTGVEMEALMGASAAALTLYDMCKAMSHDIEISQVRLLAKRGGKRDYSRGAPVGATRGAPARATRAAR
jgi:cyclic pyranopterin phosphate synthase